jgi:hypothetical protein
MNDDFHVVALRRERSEGREYLTTKPPGVQIGEVCGGGRQCTGGVVELESILLRCRSSTTEQSVSLLLFRNR